jgi:hypothetical protein
VPRFKVGASILFLAVLLLGMLVPTAGELAAKSRQAHEIEQIHVGPWGGSPPDTACGGPGDPSAGTDSGDPDDLLDLTLPWILWMVNGPF